MPDTTPGIENFIRPELMSFTGYSACKSPDAFEGKRVVKLDANENNYGASPGVRQAMCQFNEYHIYPDATQSELRLALAEYTGVDACHIVASSGSDQLIDVLIRLFCAPGDEIINLPPTFAMFQFYAGLQGAKVVSVPRGEDYGIDVAGIKKAVSDKTRLIFIANPNNPTGTITPRCDIEEVLELGLPTVVDEAYYEFTGQTFAPQVGKIPNLMVLRTFSKWAGLAGLRVGYGLFPQRVDQCMHAIRDPYNVNVAAVLAARQSLKDAAYLKEKVALIVAERERLYAELLKIDWLKAYPSQSNFILCRLEGKAARDVQAALEARAILVRCFDSPGLKNCLRFSVGTPEEDDILLEVLKEM
jgi:histidinol-phosphate aminotransferase